MDAIVRLIHKFEDLKRRVPARLDELKSLIRDMRAKQHRTAASITNFEQAGRYVPKVLKKQHWNVEASLINAQGEHDELQNELDAVTAKLAEAVDIFDTSAYDGRLNDDISQLEAETLNLHTTCTRAARNIALATKQGRPADSGDITLVDQQLPKIGEICDQLAELYLRRRDRYERVKYLCMLEALKSRSQQTQAQVGTHVIKVVGVEKSNKIQRYRKPRRYVAKGERTKRTGQDQIRANERISKRRNKGAKTQIGSKRAKANKPQRGGKRQIAA